MLRGSRLALAGCALAALLSAGCIGGAAPPPEYFALMPLAGADGAALPAARPGLGLAIGPIEIPRYLDRPELVTRDGAHRLDVWDGHRWGGSLRTDILRVMSDDLGTLLATPHVAVYPVEPRFPLAYRVLLDLLEFEGVPGRSVVLRARWMVTSGGAERALAVESFRVEQPVASPSFDDLVAAHSAALGALSREIAVRIADLSAK